MLDIKKIHFCGIGGTGMAAVAVLFNKLGYSISGSDHRIYPPMSDYLAAHKIPVFEGYKPANIVQAGADLYIIGNVLSRGNLEVEAILNNSLPYASLAELLKFKLLQKRRNIVITGTHGKTTTTALCAFLLFKGGLNPGFMIGGLPGNFKESARAGEDKGWFVIEGDEYDSSLFDKRSKFLHYLPKIAVINNIEFDHADIFQNLAMIKKSFRLLLRQIPANGLLLANGDDADVLEVAADSFSPLVTFGFCDSCTVKISNPSFSANDFASSCTIEYSGQKIKLATNLPGEFNLKNAVAASLVANHCGVSWETIKAGLLEFKNSQRRLSKINRSEKVWLFDDFAHHPTAIFETIKALKLSYPNARLHAIYEPGSNTALRDYHQAVLPDAFAKADFVIIHPPEAWRLLDPDSRLNIDSVIGNIGAHAVALSGADEILQRLKQQVKQGDIVLFMSQKNSGEITNKIVHWLDQDYL